MAAAAGIDLSKLPPPSVIDPLDFEGVLVELKATLLGLDPTLAPVLALESEPLVKLLETVAYRDLLNRSRVNQAALAVMTAFADGPDLDQLLALVGAVRLQLTPGDPTRNIAPTYERDDDFRARGVTAPEGFSVAGPVGAYVYLARSAHPDVLDASAISPAPGQVLVSILSRQGDGSAAQPVLDAVFAALNADEVRPLTDQVSVASAVVLPVDVSAQLFTFRGPDNSLVVAAAQARLSAYLAGAQRLGREMPLSALYAALHVDGVQRVRLTSPLADVPADETQAIYPRTVSVVFGGYGE